MAQHGQTQAVIRLRGRATRPNAPGPDSPDEKLNLPFNALALDGTDIPTTIYVGTGSRIPLRGGSQPAFRAWHIAGRCESDDGFGERTNARKQCETHARPVGGLWKMVFH
jgi:hypothetical protein